MGSRWSGSTERESATSGDSAELPSDQAKQYGNLRVSTGVYVSSGRADTEQRRSCSVEGRNLRRVRRGWCRRHYRELAGSVDPVSPTATDAARFAAKVDTSGGPDACHLWMAGRHKRGYGKFQVRNQTQLAHRWLLGHLRGEPLGANEYACHHCDNPPCVNAKHLYIGDALTNARDMVVRERNSLNEFRKRRTHCLHGHEWTPENTYVHGGGRKCKACNVEVQRRLAEGLLR